MGWRWVWKEEKKDDGSGMYSVVWPMERVYGLGWCDEMSRVRMRRELRCTYNI